MQKLEEKALKKSWKNWIARLVRTVGLARTASLARTPGLASYRLSTTRDKVTLLCLSIHLLA